MNWVYHHDLDPFLWHFGGGVGIRWYGLAYLAGFVLGYVLLRWQMSRGWVHLEEGEDLDLVLTVAIAGVLGGRLGYVLLYGPGRVVRDPFSVFRIWEGGMSIHGGVAGAVVGLLWFARRFDYDFWTLADAASLATPPGLFLGRVANFINGELWGRPTGEGWGVVFPRAPGSGVPRHPSQLYEAVLEGVVLLMLLVMVRRRADRPGVVSGSFLASYGILRFLVEFVRAPDPHIGYELWGMTRGQEYSVLFVLLGLLVVYLGRRSSPVAPSG